MKPAAEILHYAEIYINNLRYHNAMERSKDPDRYYREHDVQINLFNAAEHVLKDVYHINPAIMNFKHMQEAYSLMDEKNPLSLPPGNLLRKNYQNSNHNNLKVLKNILALEVQNLCNLMFMKRTMKKSKKSQNQNNSQRKLVNIYKLKKCIKISGTHSFGVSTGLLYRKRFSLTRS